MRQLVIPLLFLLFAGSISAKTKLWVSPAGSGTEFSETSPGSLTASQLNAKILNLRKEGVQNIEVFLLPGVYPIIQTINISQNLAGSLTDTLSFIGSHEGKATLSGGKSVSGWQAIENGIYRTQLPTEADFRQLYVNGKMAVRARTPNRENETNYGPYYKIKSFYNNDRAKMRINLPEVEPFTNALNKNNVEMVIHQHWMHSRIKVDSYTTSGTDAIVLIKWGLVDWGTANLPYYWENDLTFLDAEGEWYLDGEKMLYYKPRSGEDINQVEVIYPATVRLLNIGGTAANPVRNVSIENIEFIYSNWTAPNTVPGTRFHQGAYLLDRNISEEASVRVRYADQIHITNCNILGVGCYGIHFEDVRDSDITACHFDQISANAVKINNGADNLVAHNLIENFGMNYTNGMSLCAGNVPRLVVENNEIRFGRYGGMEITGGGTESIDAMIRYNNVHHVMLLHDDSGGIYVTQWLSGTKIYQNWVHDIARGPWAMDYAVAGIYLDDGSAFITVSDNVLMSPLPQGTLQTFEQTSKGTHDNTWLNNNTQSTEIINASGTKRITGVITNLPPTGLIKPASSDSKLKVWPNPATISLTVENAKWESSPVITIYNTNGVKVRTYPVASLKTVINTSNFPAGIYIVESGRQTTTIIIQRYEKL